MATTPLIPDEQVILGICQRKPITIWEVAAKMGGNNVRQASALLEGLTANGTLAKFKVGFNDYYASPKVALTRRGPTFRTVVSDSLKNLLLGFRYKVARHLE